MGNTCCCQNVNQLNEEIIFTPRRKVKDPHANSSQDIPEESPAEGDANTVLSLKIHPAKSMGKSYKYAKTIKGNLLKKQRTQQALSGKTDTAGETTPFSRFAKDGQNDLKGVTVYNNINTNNNEEQKEIEPFKTRCRQNSMPIRPFGRRYMGIIEEYYDLMECLSKTNCSEIYRVRNKRDGTIRALKIVHRPEGTRISTEFYERWNNLKAMVHAKLARYHEFYQGQYCNFVILEFCEGGNLFDHLLNLKACPETVVANIMEQLLTAVCYCHKRKRFHINENRELAPDNILLETPNDEASIKIINYGRKSIVENASHKPRISHYESPQRDLSSEQRDLWSCGAILHLLLFGTPPALIGPAQPPRCSEAALDLLKKLLSAVPTFSALSALSHPWIKRASPTIIELGRMHQHLLLAKLQTAVVNCASTHTLAAENQGRVKQLFDFMDSDGDGEISIQDLVKGYKKMYYGNCARAKKELDQIEKFLKFSSGYDCTYYYEFLNANLQIQRALNREKLRQAFDSYREKGEVLLVEDIYTIFYPLCIKERIEGLVKRACIDNVQRVSLEELLVILAAYEETQIDYI